MSRLTQLRALKLHNAVPSRRQPRADLIDLRDSICILEATETFAVLFGFVVDFRRVALFGVFFNSLEHEEYFGGRESLFVGHVAEFETGGGFFVSGGCWTAARGLYGGGACHLPFFCDLIASMMLLCVKRGLWKDCRVWNKVGVPYVSSVYRSEPQYLLLYHRPDTTQQRILCRPRHPPRRRS